MFRITNLIVDDKQLPAFLHAIAGKVRSMDIPVPIVNVTVGKDGQLAQETEGSMLSMFLAYLRKKKLTQVRPPDVRAFLEELGRSPQSATYVLKKAVEVGALRKRGKGSKVYYDVVEG